MLAGVVLVAVAGAGCGRSLPDEGPVATGPAQTGAFEESEAEGAIRGVGAAGAPNDYLQAVADAVSAEDPTVKLSLTQAEPDFDALCQGEVDVAAALGDRAVCDAAVGFTVAKAGKEPVVFYVNRDSLLQTFELESLIQYAVDNGESLSSQAGLEPLSIDELQETQTKLEQAIAGVG